MARILYGKEFAAKIKEEAGRAAAELKIKGIQPRLAVISVGRDNNFGHPAPEVIERLQKNGIKIYRTDEDGAVVCRTDGKTLRVGTFR